MRLQPPYHTGSSALKRLFETVGLGDEFSAESKNHVGTVWEGGFSAFMGEAIAKVHAFRDASKKCNEICDRIMLALNCSAYVHALQRPCWLAHRHLYSCLCFAFVLCRPRRLSFPPIMTDFDILPFVERFQNMRRLPTASVACQSVGVL